MAGVTKISLVYPRRFWDVGRSDSNMGLPSQLGGPAFQVYDSSNRNGSVAGLTFFALTQQSNNPVRNEDKLLADQVAEQMAKIWHQLGLTENAKLAYSFTHYYVQRWPTEAYLSEDSMPTRINPHPTPVFALSQPEWDGALQFAGSETDLLYPGVMEGAVGAARRVLESLSRAFD